MKVYQSAAEWEPNTVTYKVIVDDAATSLDVLRHPLIPQPGSLYKHDGVAPYCVSTTVHGTPMVRNLLRRLIAFLRGKRLPDRYVFIVVCTFGSEPPCP